MNGQKRLKVLFLHGECPPDVNPLAGIFVREHARAACLWNDIVVLYAYPDPARDRRNLPRVSEVREDGIRTIRVRYGGIVFSWWRKITRRKNGHVALSEANSRTAGYKRLLAIPRVAIADLIYYWSILWAFRRLVRQGWRPDVIHAHVYSAGVPAAILKRLYQIPVLVTEHSSAFPRHLLTGTERLKARFAMNRAEMVLPVSDYLRVHIESYGVKSEFRVVPNVVDTEVFYPVPQYNEEAAQGHKRLLFVGNLIAVKGLPYLLEALGQIRQKRQDYGLDVVGDGASRSEYEELASRLGLDGIVRFHGAKPREQVAQFMRECAFLVQPSLQETFGVVYIEAMACGKPVIATSAGGPKEFVDEDVGVLVPPEDTGALRDAIEYMLDNHQRYSCEKIARHARERFSYEAVGRMLDEVYREVLTR